MNRPPSFINMELKCKPLAITTYTKQDQPIQYIELPSEYTLSQMNKLQTYLCPYVKLRAVDFVQKIQKIPKIKNKKIFVQGIGAQNKQKYKARNYEEFQRFDWEIDVSIPMELNPNERDASQQLKNQIISNLVLLLKKDGSTQQIIDTQQVSMENLKRCKLFYVTSFSKKQLFQGNSNKNKNKKVMVNRIPVKILLPKLQNYNVDRIIQMIGEDLASAINIMSESQLFYRVVHRHNGLPIQNYFSKENQKDEEYQKLITADKIISQAQSKPKKNIKDLQINRLQQQIQQKAKLYQKQPISPPVMITSPSKKPAEVATGSNKNQSLILIALLIIIIGTYAAFKVL